MVLAALLALTLASIGGCSRTAEQDRLEPHVAGAVASQLEAAQGSNIIDAADDEIGNRCCCYSPFFKTYETNPNRWFGPPNGLRTSDCPAIGCTHPEGGEDAHYGPCSDAFVRASDVFCKMVGMFGCNAKSGLEEEVPPEWKECYGVNTSTGMPLDCMRQPIKRR
mmetsp:Transcript_59879/g.110888  ORF Transcript_59879/g.110888 Transcript_59879/m.110888 type:complete len:165 (+) Transcript_59879:73-567(+)